MSYIRCWTCQGNGITKMPGKPVTLCPACKGTGADAVKTKQSQSIPAHEKHIPQPLVLK